MYNSSIKKQGKKIEFKKQIEIPGKVFFNDMSKSGYREEWRECDCIYSGIAWQYGYKIFNENAGNIPNEYSQYCKNINTLIETLKVPSFITGGKQHRKFFKNAKEFDIDLNNFGTDMPGVKLFVWNYDYNGECRGTSELLSKLSKEFRKPLDFSCGYGQHLLKFDDFIACDIDRNCLTYLSILVQEKEKMERENV